jgi:hypothetical protein
MVAQIFKDAEKNITLDRGPLTELKPPEIKILTGNFLSSGFSEYLISYFQRISYRAYTSGVFVSDEKGNILKKVFDITPADFNYSRVVGIVDINSDGIDELLTESGYFEGNRYELWKYSQAGFSKITCAFDWGL